MLLQVPSREVRGFFMFKIKKDKFRKRYEILQNNVTVFTCPVNQFADLADTIVKYVVGKGFTISAPDQQATASGYGKYHYIKGFLLAFLHDLKKKYAQKTDTTSKKA